MKQKKIVGLLLMMCVMFGISGCRLYASYVVNPNGTVTSSGEVAYTEEEIFIMGETTKNKATVKVLEDGKQYYVVPQESETKSFERVKEEDAILITDDICVFDAGMENESDSSSSSEEGYYMQVSVTLSSEIALTNGRILEDGKTVVFDSSANRTDQYWYAYTQKGKDVVQSDTTAPKMIGAKNNQYFKEMPTTINFTDESNIVEVKLNGKDVKSIISSFYGTDGKKQQSIKWYTTNGKSAEKKGKNVFMVKDLNGNQATYTIYTDSKLPVVKGVKSKKTYKKKALVYVKDNLKLTKVTINGKKQKMTKKQLVKKGKYKGYYKYTVKKKGSNKIVVRDAAGNKKILKITIKK